MEKIDIVIVGGGPAGASVALHLCKKNPSWAKRIILIEKRVHPREKLCGGGITYLGEHVLKELDLTIPETQFDIERAILRCEGRKDIVIRGRPVFKVVRRNQFDQWLISRVRRCGVEVSEDEGLVELRKTNEGIRVLTTEREFLAKVVVGADGAGSRVRKFAGLAKHDQNLKSSAPSLCALVETLTEEDNLTCNAFTNSEALFDFSVTTNGVSGYAWDFPSFVDGNAMMNRGVFDSRFNNKQTAGDAAKLKPILRSRLHALSREVHLRDIRGCTIRSYDPKKPIAGPRVLLVGDAAGADPLFGEGISFALAYGRPAANSIAEAFTKGNFAFNHYGKLVALQPEFRQLVWRTKLARYFYRDDIGVQYRRALTWTLATSLIKASKWNDSRFDPVSEIGNSQSLLAHFGFPSNRKEGLKIR